MQVHAERAVEVEDVGADRLAGGVGEADAREAEGVLERPVHQHPPERVEQPVAKGDRPAVENARAATPRHVHERSEEHTSELQSLMRISYAVFCLKKKKN